MCKFYDLCKELYPEDDERRKTCNETDCNHYDNFFEGYCLAMEYDGVRGSYAF